MAAMDAEIAELEAKAAADADRTTREATARDLNGRADRGMKTIAPMIEALTAVHV